MSGLSEEQINEIREAFFAYNNELSLSVTTSQLGDVMRTLGQSLTEAELYELTGENSTDSNLVYYNDFLQVMAKRLEEQNSLESLQQAFRIFDRNDVDYFTVMEIRTVMNNLGEKMTDDELHEMFKYMDLDNDGKVTFSDFVSFVRS